MKRLALAFILVASTVAATAPSTICTAAATAPASGDTFWGKFRAAIEQHLGKPYVTGSTGLKSFDCSGFVWRSLVDSGIYLKRTSARKLYFSLQPAPETANSSFGTIIFFDNLRHCGIVNDANSFFHADSKRGTTISPLQPYWKNKVCGFRLFL